MAKEVIVTADKVKRRERIMKEMQKKSEDLSKKHQILVNFLIHPQLLTGEKDFI